MLSDVASTLAAGSRPDPDPVAVLEAQWVRGFPHAYAIGVSSGTAALELVLRALAIGVNDEVIIPANACAAVAMAVIASGAMPVLADVDQSLTLDPRSVSEHLTGQTRAVIAVHQYGTVADLPAIAAAAGPAVVIEDCAQAAGATVAGGFVGGVGAASVFSFCSGKPISAGEGGLVSTDRADLAARVRRIANLGADIIPRYEEPGFNFALNPLTAVLARWQLVELPRRTQRRQMLAARYRAHLEGSPLFEPLSKVPCAASAYHRLALVASLDQAAYRRLSDRLRAGEIPFQSAHPWPLYRAPFLVRHYEEHRPDLLDITGRGFPRVADIEARTLFLYTNPGLGDAAADAIGRALLREVQTE